MTTAIANRIPRDVIREILSHLKSTLLTYKLEAFPWYLGHICTAWRAEFLPLCDTISIEFLGRTTGFTPPSDEGVLDVLRWFLDHNSDIPFSFALWTGYAYSSPQSPYVHRALVMLCQQSIRWLDAALYIHEEEIDVLYQVKNRIPLLQALMLHVDCPVGFQTDPDTFVDAPVLSTLKLWIRAPWNFQWSSLTSLLFYVTDKDFRTRLDVLSETVNLKELSIWTYSIENIGYDKQIILPRLTRLSISGTAALKYLRAPALVRLSIVASETEFFSTIVWSFFHRSGCNLQQLKTGTSLSDFMELVGYTPDLQHLHIAHFVDNIDIVAALQNLTAADSLITPLRHLQSLRLDNLVYSDELHRQLCAFVKFRSRRVEFEGEVIVERLRTLVILQENIQDCWNCGTELEKVCEECGIQLRCFEPRDDIPDRWW
ncbi:hypothetical protein JOM56_008900 [Amanita muscaria]